MVQKRPCVGRCDAETRHVNHRIDSLRVLKRVLVIALGATLCGAAFANDDEVPTDRTSPEAYESGWLTSDRDSNGVIDYAVQIDDRGYKTREAMDFNYDGLMDDFYFYDNDVLQRQEIDTNFDRLIDVWIFMWRGVYVRRWERDTDFDGIADLIRDYDEPQQ